MTLDEFRSSLHHTEPPPLAPLLKALWFDARGQWDAAHRLAQDVETPDGSWVHAYLHRREGDAGNAHYWYRRAGRPDFTESLSAEWDLLVQHLLKVSSGVNA